MLWRALQRVEKGFYFDVGAQSPEADSVTKAFSLAGWRGINVEPHPTYFEQLLTARPNDINLNVALGERRGSVTMSLVENSGLSTADEEIAAQHAATGYSLQKHTVDMLTLTEVWQQHVPEGQTVHFLKVDVEGLEKSVLAGNDWRRNRPWIVLVEATLPNSQIEVHEEWEPILLGADYIFSYADGLNRFYVAREQVHLCGALKYPPNVFDAFTTAREYALQEQAASLEQRLGVAEAARESAGTARVHALQEQATSLKQRLGAAEAATFSAVEQAIALRKDLSALKRDFGESLRRIECAEVSGIQAREREMALKDRVDTESAVLHTEIAEYGKLIADARSTAEVAERHAASIERQYQAVIQSPWWRITGPGRATLTRVPSPIKRQLRRVAKAVWWAATPWHLLARWRAIRGRQPVASETSSAGAPGQLDLNLYPDLGVGQHLFPPMGPVQASRTHRPRLALDTYVLAQGIKTGVYRVCDELFPLLASSDRLDCRLFVRPHDEAKTAVLTKRFGAPAHLAPSGRPSEDADVLLSPFGLVPPGWRLDDKVLHAHVVYDLIGVTNPEYFSAEAAVEVKRIMDSLDQQTVIFAISEFTKNALLSYRSDLSERQVTVVPLAAGSRFHPCEDALQRAAVRAKYGIPSGVPYILSLATLEIRKNLDQVVHALVSHLEECTDSELHLVLSGMSGWKLEQLDEALAKYARWRHRIVLTGFVEDADLSALYSDAVCFAYLSRAEGFGLPPLEAMACGTPVICANNTSLPEVVGQAGLLFDADDVQGVAHAMGRIASSPALRRELAEAGLDRARLFSWERCADIIVNTLLAAYAERCSGRLVPVDEV